MISSEKYTIYTGETVLKRISCNIMLLLLLGLLGLFFMKDSDSANISFVSFSLIPSYVLIIFFSMSQIYLYLNFGKENKYYLTVNNSYECYKSYYKVTYLSIVLTLAAINLIVGMEYLSIKTTVNIFLLIKNIVIVLFFMSILPFIFICRKQIHGLIKSVIYYTIFMGFFILGLYFELVILTVIMAVMTPAMFVFSNKLWLKTMKEKYENGKE